MALLAPTTEAGRLTQRYRSEQARRAAIVAALVAAYYRQKVQVANPASVERWLDLMVPKVIAEMDAQAERAVRWGNRLRTLEIGYDDGHRWEKSVGAVAEQVRASLAVVGPAAHTNKLDLIEDRVAGLKPAERGTMRKALERDAQQAAETQIMGSVLRHTQNGSRQTQYENVKRDPVALGYVRVTRNEPCYFCVMLASRGVVYGDDSFDASDARFTGEGTVKVHDHCQCAFKPVYTPQADEYVKRSDQWETMWREFSGEDLTGRNPLVKTKGASADSIRFFRNNYNAWLRGEIAFDL